LGIDLGTTHTVLAVNAEALSIADGSTLLPSVIAHLPSGETLVGAPARNRRALDPGNTILAAKRLIGRKSTSRAAGEYRELHPSLDLVEATDGMVQFRTRAGVFSPIDVAALIVTHACEHAALDPAQVVAAVTVPTRFDSAQRDATVAAINKAGIQTIAIVDEPQATAMAYSTFGGGGLCAVYDLGGGTFDFAIVDCNQEPFQVLATDGDPHLGGDDVDLALAKWARGVILEEHGWDAGMDPVVFDSLATQCESAKIELTYEDDVVIELQRIDLSAPAGTLTLDREILASVTKTLVQRSFIICDEVLHRAGKKARDVDHVFLAGGSSLLPSVWSGLKAFFGRSPRCDFPPMEVVAIGAGLAAAGLGRLPG
jgi:molecular chaperone DnaK